MESTDPSRNSLLSGLSHLFESHGGMEGLVEKLRHAGLGATVDSWLSEGANLPIAANAIQKVLGSESIQKFAEKVGLPPEEVIQHLTKLLPQTIDKMSHGQAMNKAV